MTSSDGRLGSPSCRSCVRFFMYEGRVVLRLLEDGGSVAGDRRPGRRGERSQERQGESCWQMTACKAGCQWASMNKAQWLER